MRLIIHMGCHKTGTTSFQKTCEKLADDLRAAGVLYSVDSDRLYPFQHSELAWDASVSEYGRLRAILRAAATDDSLDTVLISGEDFESFLVQTDIARRIEEVAVECGVTEIEWIVVYRDPFHYFESIYAQLSRSPCGPTYRDAARAILDTGLLNVGRLTRGWIYVFDLARFLPRFRVAVSGTVTAIPFQTFVAGSSGRMLLERMLGQDKADRLLAHMPGEAKHENKRAPDRVIERRYAARFLGQPSGDSSLSGRLLSRLLVAPVASYRLRERRRLRAEIARRFEERFADPATVEQRALALEPLRREA